MLGAISDGIARGPPPLVLDEPESDAPADRLARGRLHLVQGRSRRVGSRRAHLYPERRRGAVSRLSPIQRAVRRARLAGYPSPVERRKLPLCGQSARWGFGMRHGARLSTCCANVSLRSCTSVSSSRLTAEGLALGGGSARRARVGAGAFSVVVALAERDGIAGARRGEVGEVEAADGGGHENAPGEDHAGEDQAPPGPRAGVVEEPAVRAPRTAPTRAADS